MTAQQRHYEQNLPKEEQAYRRSVKRGIFIAIAASIITPIGGLLVQGMVIGVQWFPNTTKKIAAVEVKQFQDSAHFEAEIKPIADSSIKHSEQFAEEAPVLSYIKRYVSNKVLQRELPSMRKPIYERP